MSPFILNYILIAIYSLNMIQFAIRGMYADAFYWSGALWITLAVTFGYHR